MKKLALAATLVLATMSTANASWVYKGTGMVGPDEHTRKMLTEVFQPAVKAAYGREYTVYANSLIKYDKNTTNCVVNFSISVGYDDNERVILMHGSPTVRGVDFASNLSINECVGLYDDVMKDVAGRLTNLIKYGKEQRPVYGN